MSVVNSGVPQGWLLALILFSFFINDFFLIPINNNINAFADDTKLYGEVTAVNSLQTDLTLIGSWFTANKLKFNYEKWTVLHLARNNPGSQYKLVDYLLITS